MNKYAKIQTIPGHWVDKCREWGQVPFTNSLTGHWGIADRNDPRRRIQGKLGEVGTALYHDLDPHRVVSWRHVPEPYDVPVYEWRVDTKTTRPWYKLIWSLEKNDQYEASEFDALVAVSNDERDYGTCWIEGVVSKGLFYKKKSIADGSNGLTPGTWFMRKEDLADIDSLKNTRPLLAANISL